MLIIRLQIMEMRCLEKMPQDRTLFPDHRKDGRGVSQATLQLAMKKL